MKLKEAAKKVEDGIEETLTYCDFPGEHWTRIRTNNVIERLNREIRRRTRVVGTFPDGNSALMLVCARLRHVAGTQWGNASPSSVAVKSSSFSARYFSMYSSWIGDFAIVNHLHLFRDNIHSHNMVVLCQKVLQWKDRHSQFLLLQFSCSSCCFSFYSVVII